MAYDESIRSHPEVRMQYIPRIDEILSAPPYRLGAGGKELGGPFEASMFVVPADPNQLQAVLDQQINAAISPSAKVRYSVPSSVRSMFIGFYRYGRAESTCEPAKGWMQYSEVMFGFLAMRPPLPDEEGSEQRLVTYLGVVYIDQYGNTNAPCDPSAIPVILGRESYGMPKNPGKVLYEPGRYGPGNPKLSIWDTEESGGRLVLRDALRVSPQDTADRFAPANPLKTAKPPPSPKGLGSLHLLAHQLGTSHANLDPQRKASRRDAVAGSNDEVLVQIPQTDERVVAHSGLLWGTQLLGLKQFPDPASEATPPNGMGKAAYHAIVETPLKEVGHTISPVVWPLYNQVLEFPPTMRCDLPSTFGISVDGPRRKIVLRKDSVYYFTGVLAFADPKHVYVSSPQAGSGLTS
jgi:hypothetical protein